MPTNSWLLGWATADVPTAAEFAKGSGSIYSTRLGAPAATLDLASIPASYGDLEIQFALRGDTVAAQVNLFCRFNNDSAANYDYQSLVSTAATVSTGETFAATSGLVGVVPAASDAAGLAGAGTIVIPNYAGTAFNKVAWTLGEHKQGTASGNLVLRQDGVFWRSSAAINRVTLLLSAGNFDTGSYVNIRVKGI